MERLLKEKHAKLKIKIAGEAADSESDEDIFWII